MTKLWKPFAALGTALKDSFKPDLFTWARWKIAFLYLLMGFFIFVVGSWLIYGHILSLIQSVLGVVQQSLTSRNTPDPNATAQVVAQAIRTEISKMNLAVGLWMIFTMALVAYALASITLLPIKRAMERQKRFVANIAHELRTPLSVMKTNSEVALLNHNGPAPDPEVVGIVRGNLEEIDRMSKIIRFLLNRSSLEMQLEKLEFSTVDVGEALAKAVQMLRKSAEEKEVRLSLELSGQGTIPGNPVALEEMFVNLVKNAIAYTPAGGTVRAGLLRGKHGVILATVEDTGIGIPPKDLPNIFEPFYRGENAFSQRSRKRGTGIGLAIVREIADLHKATIGVKSELGKGTAITIRFSPPLFG